MSAANLPPLPRPSNWIGIQAGLTGIPRFSEEQMTAYGQASRNAALLEAMNATRAFGKTGEVIAIVIKGLL